MKPKAKPRRVAKAKPVSKPAGEGWRMEDLPASAQVELRDRLARAEHGEGLQDFDEALAEADRMAEKVLAIVKPSDKDHRAA